MKIHITLFLLIFIGTYTIKAQQEKLNGNIKMSSQEFSELIKTVIKNRSKNTVSENSKTTLPKLKKIKIPKLDSIKTKYAERKITKDSVVYLTKIDTVYSKKTIHRNQNDTIVSKVPYYVYENDTIHRNNVTYLNNEYTYTKENLSDVNEKLDEIEEYLEEVKKNRYIETKTQKVNLKDTVFIKTYAENPNLAPKFDSLNYYIGKNRQLLERINSMSDSLNNKELPTQIIEKNTIVKEKIPEVKQGKHSIYFPIGKTSIDELDKTRFINFYANLIGNNAQPKSVIVNGYASPVGKLSVNQKVSADRTMSAVNMLKSLGINDDLIEFNVKGIDYNAKNNSQAQRVDVIIKY
ncbi:MAG: OmpA family protein [Flavobacteriales bacterium]|nr:OmpA family protein [Flavobacteriales bacterium]